MIIMVNVHEFNCGHPERPGYPSICPKYVYNVDSGSVIDVALTKRKSFQQSLPQITCSSRQPCAAAG